MQIQILKNLIYSTLLLGVGTSAVFAQRELKKADTDADFTLYINAASNVLETDSKKFSPAQVGLPTGNYRVKAKVDAYFAGQNLPVKKVVFSALSFPDPHGYTWTIRDGEEFDVSLTQSNVYGYFVDTFTPDNTGGAVLMFKKLN